MVKMAEAMPSFIQRAAKYTSGGPPLMLIRRPRRQSASSSLHAPSSAEQSRCADRLGHQ